MFGREDSSLVNQMKSNGDGELLTMYQSDSERRHDPTQD